MSDLRHKPATELMTNAYETGHVRVGCSGMQGWRKKMEDAHCACVNFLDGKKDSGLFGVYDGHQGRDVAKYVAKHLPNEFQKSEVAKAGDFASAFKVAYMSLDSTLQAQTPQLDGGCTAVSVLMHEGMLYCANAGDSRAVLARSGEKAIPLSFDHKPSLPEEKARVEKAGGTISSGRVNGMLSLTRAIGDFDLKQNATLPLAEQAITAFPDVMTVQQTQKDEFLILACDGVWDVLDNDECVDFVRQKLVETNNDVALVCEQVLERCLAPTSPGVGTDNMTIIIVQPKDPWKNNLPAQS